MRADLYARCPRCGEMMSLDPDETVNCRCGSLYKDEMGRFGYTFGDDSIEIYRQN